MDAQQRLMVLRPTVGQPANFGGLRAGDESFSLRVPGATSGQPDTLELWWLPHPDPQAPALLYLHGTFRNLYDNLPKLEALRNAGFSVLAVDYRGWGRSTPLLPSEATIDADAQAAWNELAQRQPAPHKRVIWGHSMGSAVAVTLASRQRAGTHYAALVLESSFTSMPDVAKEAGLLGHIASWFSTLKFNSLAKVDQIDAPVLMLHGTMDNTVPIELGRRLRDAAAARVPVQWVEFEGGSHNELYREDSEKYQKMMSDLAQRLTSESRNPGPGFAPR